MKTKLLLFLLLLSLTITAQTNLVPNGNFETWSSSSQPDNWYRFFSGYVSQSATAQNGKSSTNMMVATGTFNYINSEYFAVQANKTYRVTLYHRAVKGTFSSIDLSLYHKPSTFKEEIIKKSDVTFSTTEWRKIEFEYTSKVAENIEVDIWTNGSLNSEILIDNVSVVDVADVPVQYTLIPDPEFERRLISLGYDKDGVNGKVLTSNIANVKSFEVSYLQTNIKDLTGIEDFEALENLIFRGNTGKLTSLDVSKNLKLKSLDCSSNELTSLNLSKNIVLESLNCGSNKLTSLDISQNTALKSLTCSSNKLTSLDPTNNIKLTFISLENNLLESLNLSNNKELTTLTCYSNKITSLDFSGKPLLSIVDFSFNKLTNLDVTENPALKTLICKSNQLTALNLSKNIILERLSCSQNSLTTLDLINNVILKSLESTNDKLVSLNITKNPALVYLDCSANALTKLDVSNNKGLLSLNCSSNSLQTIDVSNNLLLTSLQADRNRLSNIDILKNTKIEDLDVEANSISVLDVSKLPNLGVFSFGNNNIKSIDVSNNLNLRYFYSSNNKLESVDLSKNKALLAIQLSNNKLYDLNLKNGNNANFIAYLDFTHNSGLTCILVDDEAYANQNWRTYKDSWASFSTDCRKYTAIPDANFENKLIDLKIDTDGKNGKVLTSSIETIKTLDVSGSNIASLAGIQDFKVLEVLNAKNNLITYLDLSKNQSLSSIECSENKLVSLDLKNGKNTLLNKNTSFFSNNPSLKCIQVDDENYSNTNWSALKDVTANYNTLCNSFTAIPDANFENKLIALGIDIDGKNGKVLTSSISSITTLDISSSSISNLTGIEGFTTLKQLNISSNNLKAIDLTKNVLLTSVNAKSNQLLNLDLSKNTALQEADFSANNLFSLNLKNGKNATLTAGNFKSNPNLTCIQVDDKGFSDANWSNFKETTASYNLVCDNNNFTLIPDTVFENRLITLGIDKDGLNGGVLTSSISSVKELNIYISQGSKDLAINDLTGIQDFKALEKLNVSNNQLNELDLSGNANLKELNCSYNRLEKINLSKNILLTKVDCSNNIFTQIDFSKNVQLLTVNCQDNKLTGLDFSKNPQFNYLYANNNKLTSLNLTANPNMGYLNCANSLLENLDLSNNKYINYLFCEGNRLKSLDVSNVISLNQFGCDDNLLTTINVSKNANLSQFSCSKNQLTNLDLSNNAELWTLRCHENKLTTLNISKNKKLASVNCSSNNLVNLNIKNGNNANFTGFDNDYALNFKDNPDLTCIQVDDITYANTKLESRKDATASFNTNCGISLILPNDNFTIETKGESCLGENNGEISITAKAAYSYQAVINGKTYPFTNNIIKIASLTPGAYSISISIVDESFEQNFNFTITKATTVSGNSNTSGKKVNLEITAGTAPFTVFIDGAEQFQTNEAAFSVDVNKAALVEVATSKACEGIFAKKVSVSDFDANYQILSAYPNPTSGSFEIEIPTAKNEVTIELYNFSGQLISAKTYAVESGKAQLNLENQPSGIYAAKIYLDTPEYIKIIKK